MTEFFINILVLLGGILLLPGLVLGGIFLAPIVVVVSILFAPIIIPAILGTIVLIPLYLIGQMIYMAVSTVFLAVLILQLGFIFVIPIIGILFA